MSNDATYYTVIIPPVPGDLATEWHAGDTLSRGAFVSERHAIIWARAHLQGTPYSVRKVAADADALLTSAPTPTTGNKYAVYVCTDRRCDDYKQELSAALPSDVRGATGRAATCPVCGAVLFLRRIEWR